RRRRPQPGRSHSSGTPGHTTGRWLPPPPGRIGPFDPSWLSPRQLFGRLTDGVGDVVNVLVRVALGPRQHQDPLEPGEGPGEAGGVVVDRLRPRQGEGVAAGAERALFLEDLAHERRLLDVARRGGDASLLQPSAELDRPALDDPAVDLQKILPVGVDAPRVHPWRVDAAKPTEPVGEATGGGD